jgi:hypothetical protein
LIEDLGCALGCFGGNLLWPIQEFKYVGGFHNELSHGRVEDGECALRAAAAAIPMSLVREARGWHVAHPVDVHRTAELNRREVPLLNSWHPEIQDKGFLLVERDGARFDFKCPEPGCGLQMNSHDYWNHVASHRNGTECMYADPASVRRFDG